MFVTYLYGSVWKRDCFDIEWITQWLILYVCNVSIGQHLFVLLTYNSFLFIERVKKNVMTYLWPIILIATLLFKTGRITTYFMNPNRSGVAWSFVSACGFQIYSSYIEQKNQRCTSPLYILHFYFCF